MAAAAAAALLDELMGRNRNVLPNEKPKELNWEDREFCKMYFVKFCPHDLFVNTRVDLGACPKLHDDEAREMYKKAPYSHRKQQCEEDFVRFCQSMLNDVERKIVKGKQRLALMGKSDTPTLSPAQTQKNEEQIMMLTEKINKLVEDAEQCGIQGNVEQAQGLMRLCDKLKEERESLTKSNDNSHYNQTAELAAAQEKQMEVCDVCGAFLIVGDAQQRIDDHLQGKQHMGYARLKMAMLEVQDWLNQARLDRDRSRDRDRKKSRDDDRRKKEKRDREKDRERDRDKDRSKDKDRDSREKRRKKDDEHRNHPSDHKSSKHRSRSRSKDRQSRHRDGHRHKDKDSHSQRNSHRDRKHKSRSRSRSHK